MTNNKDKMHPEDLRNLMIFAVLSLCIWFAYETYVMKPKALALKQAREARAELVEKNPEFLNVKTLKHDEALALSPRLPFENEQISGSIALKGGRIDDVRLRQYFQTLEKKDTVILLSPDKVENARYMDYGWVSADKNLSLPTPETVWRVQGNDRLAVGAPVTLVWENGQGLTFERVIELDDRFVFHITQNVTNNSSKSVSLYPFSLVSQVGIPKDNHGNWAMHEGPVSYVDGTLNQVSFQGMVKAPNQVSKGSTGWIGISDKYWLTALIPVQGAEAKYRFKYLPHPIKQEMSRYQMDFTGAAVEVAAGGKASSALWFYAGAKKVFMLEDYEKKLGVRNLDLAVDFGWFWFFTYPFFLALHYIGLWTGNMGWAIVIMTVIVRGAVFPLTNFSYRSFAKMKVVAPRIAELREQYGDDKEKLQAEIVELYQKEGVNPMSGCLPILIQIPLFFAFYKTIFVTIEVRHAPFFGWIQDLSAKDPTSVFNLFGLLPYSVPSFLVVGAWPCLMMIAMIMQKNLNPPPQDKIQRHMMQFFPFYISYLMASSASGLVIYWAFSAFLSVLQQSIIMRSMGVPVYFFNKEHYEKEAQKKLEKGPSVNPLIAMVEDEAEKALFGEDGEQTPPNVTPPKPKKKKKKT